MNTFVRAATLSNYAEIATSFGLEPAAMLRRLGIDRRALVNKDLRIPGIAVGQLLEISAREADCPTFGLRMAESRRISDFGAVSLLITHQATMRDTLMTVIQYRQLLNEALVIDVEEYAEVVVVRAELAVGDDQPLRQADELVLGVLYRIFRTVLGSQWRARSVHFNHAAPADLSVHRRVFGPITQFGSDFTGLSCSRADLDAPNAAADPALTAYAERFIRTLPDAEGPRLAAEVQKAIYLMLPLGEANIGRVAVSLGLTARTLQRRLAREGAEFSALLNSIRRELVVRYVANDSFALTRVAGLIGYSRQSSFNRWFADEFGLAPTRWREALREAGSS